MRRWFAAPAGQHWRWKGEPVVWMGATLLLSIALVWWAAFIVGGAVFVLVGWRLEQRKAPCLACGSLIPINEAARLERLLYVRPAQLAHVDDAENYSVDAVCRCGHVNDVHGDEGDCNFPGCGCGLFVVPLGGR